MATVALYKINNELFHIKISTRSDAKYDVFRGDNGDKYVLSFGSRNHEHYFDKLGQFKHLNHKDKKRLQNFRARFKDLYNENKYNPYSAIFWAWNILW